MVTPDLWDDDDSGDDESPAVSSWLVSVLGLAVLSVGVWWLFKGEAGMGWGCVCIGGAILLNAAMFWFT